MKRVPANRALIACVFGALLCSGVLGYTGSTYLASTGPAPLRFLPAPQPVVVREHAVTAVAPPKNDTTATAPQIPPMVLPTESIFVSSPLPLFSPLSATPTLSAQPIVGLQTNAVGGAVQPDDVVSPQMLLKYFNRSSNGVDTSLYLPMNVPTPTPAQTAPSKATYTNAP